MPSATGDAKTLSSENILDLRGLADSELQVIDVSGREWPIAADLPLRTAVALLSYAQEWEVGTLSASGFDATIDGMLAVLRRGTPTTTRDEVIDSFSVSEMISIISFLSARLRARAETPNGSTELAPEKAETPRPARSRRASGAGS